MVIYLDDREDIHMKKGRKKGGKRKTEATVVRRLAGGVISGAAALALLFLARTADGFAQWYTRYIYPALVSTIGRVMGMFPCSVAEALLYILILAVLVLAVRLIVRIFQKKAGARDTAAFGAGLFLAAGILLFVYAACCGVNYYRDSFADTIGLEARGGSVEELKAVCKMLTEKVNEASGKVKRDETDVMRLENGSEEKAVEAMEYLGETYECLDGFYPKPKGLFCPWILSVQKLTGVYSPFTVEANYNSGMPDYNKLFTMCHELAHLRGFMEEKEANFIGYLSCVSSGDKEMEYSGYLTGWVYCMNALWETDPESWGTLKAELTEAAKKDLAVNNAYWEKYDGRIAETANKINDTYLKANGQAEGVVSYDRMVELILAYYRDGKR